MTKDKQNSNISLKHIKRSRRSNVIFIVFGALCLFFLCLFTALGIWQVKRLAWKNALIENVNARIHLEAVIAPPKNQWDKVTFDKDEYRPVYISGDFLHDKEILVTAVNLETTGYNVLTPLKLDDNTIVFINRGFVPMDYRDPEKRQAGNSETHVTLKGLLRMREGDGFFPRKNNPEKNIWYSREIPAMAKKLGLENVAPYFIDADNSKNLGGLPIGGLTVVSFHNNHLNYAITWFLLSFGVLGASIFLILSEYNKRRDT